VTLYEGKRGDQATIPSEVCSKECQYLYLVKIRPRLQG